MHRFSCLAVGVGLVLSQALPCLGQERVVPREGTEWCDIWMTNANRTDLPRVLLIGDSVTRGYTSAVEKQLAGKMYVARLATSRCVGDPVLLAEVAAVLGGTAFDVIHFNNGLHGVGAVSEAEYAKYLPQLLAQIRRLAPKAKLIWASCTPWHVAGNFAAFDPNNEHVKERNRIAAELMARENIPVDDLYATVSTHPEWSADTLHYNAKGTEAEGAQVAAAVLKFLK
ncbi:MAG: hypothetical protein JWO94_2674 [Verrucomicrobiaceae bacterium]|nr:hypothetical protein [Verrucomicrobiaceae bacterium]